MTITEDRPARVGTSAPASAGTTRAPWHEVVADEIDARRSLRAQIARLETVLAALLAEEPTVAAEQPRRAPVVTAGPRLLDLGELEQVRDDLAARTAVVRDGVAARAHRIDAAHARLDAMLADPAAHPGATVTDADLGRPGCTRWSVRPVLGPLGRIRGWWRVRISSGCP